MDKEKIKIGFFIDSFFPMVDGVIMVVHNYATILSKFCDVTVFAPKGRKPFDDSTLPYKVVRSKKMRILGTDYDLSFPGLDRKFLKKLKNSDLDFIHIHSPFSVGKAGLKYAKKYNVPCVASMHSQYKQDFYKATKSKLITNMMLKGIVKVFNTCDECWTVIEGAVEVFRGYGIHRQIKVFPNATDMIFYDCDAELQELRDKYDIQKDEKILLFVGRITTIKNIFFIVDSLKKLKEKNFKFKMIFVGTGPDEDKLKQEIEKNDLEDCIIMAGYVPTREELTKHYRIADLFLFPSLYDTSSLVAIEAASQKTPTLFLRGALTASSVVEDQNGFMCEDSNAVYCDKIIEIFSNPEYYSKVQEGAFKDLYMTWDKSVMQAYENYLRVIDIKKGNTTVGGKRVPAKLVGKI
ncbi:MAG: glycosyltransferase [Clostridia bacterium]|nr:glycosyltransferase [Clostridia bacterium]